jgi:hypothetical protein
VGVDLAEQPEQLPPLGRGQRAHDALVDAVEDAVEFGEAGAAGVGDGDDVAALVIRVGVAADQAVVGEFVEHGDEVAAVDAGAVGQLCLAGGPELVERGEHHEVVLAGADVAERAACDLAHLGGGHPDEALDLAFEALGRLVAPVEAQFSVGFHAPSLLQ